MTNGEMIKEIFPDTKIITQFDNPFGDRFMVFKLNNEYMQVNIDWWNAEYKEPTTKNDHHRQNIQAYAHDFGVSEEQAEKELRVTTKNDLVVDFVLRADVLKLMKDNWHTHNGDWAMQESMDDIRALPSVTPQESRKGHWIVQPSNKEQGERDFIWWKCSECGQVIFSETLHDRLEFHAFCGRCGADMREVKNGNDD